MQTLRNLAAQNWVASTLNFPLTALTSGKRVRSLLLTFTLNYTKTGADALSEDLFARWISSIRIGSYVNISGVGLWRYLQSRLGKTAGGGVAIPGSGTSGTVIFSLQIPFRDERNSGSDDGSMPCELLKDEQLAVTMAAGNIHAVGTLTIGSGTISVLADEVHETHVPVLRQLFEYRPGGQTAEIPGGILNDLLLFDALSTGAETITQAEISQVYLEGDGEVFIANALHEQLVNAYNVGAVIDQANTALVINAARYLPCVWQDFSGKSHLTKQPVAEGRFRIQVTGSLTPAIIYCRTILKQPSEIERIAEAIGAPDGAKTYEPQTASKNRLRSLDASARRGSPTRKARVASRGLPGKLRTTPTTTNAAA